MEDQEKVSLLNLGCGAAVELFDCELEKVLTDIQDPNTEEKAARTVTLKVTVKPSDRGYGKVSIQASCSLAKPNAYGTNFYIGKSPSGQVQAFEHNPQQLRLQFEEHQQRVTDAANENVTRMPAAAGE